MKKTFLFLLYIAYFLALVVGAEFILKTFFPSKIPPLDNQLPPYEYALSDNPRLGYELRPAISDINSDGLRDIEHPIEKKPGTTRILVIGDSIAYGLGVSLEETYTRKLERKLNNTARESFEVINLGVPGYGTVQIYERFLEKGLKYSPDIVIYGYWFNDHTSWGCGPQEYPFFTAHFAAVWEGYVGLLKKYPAIEKFREHILRSELLIRSFHLLHIIQQKSSPKKGTNNDILPYAAQWKSRYDETHKKNYKISFFEQYKDQSSFYKYVHAFSALTLLCKERNIRFILLTTPVMTDYNTYEYNDFHEYANYIADLLALERVEILPFFRQAGIDTVRLGQIRKDNIHFNDIGHEIVANALSAYILTSQED